MLNELELINEKCNDIANALLSQFYEVCMRLSQEQEEMHQSMLKL